MSRYEIPTLFNIWLRAFIAGIFVLALLYMILGNSIWIMMSFCVPLVWAAGEVGYMIYRVDKQDRERVR